MMDSLGSAVVSSVARPRAGRGPIHRTTCVGAAVLATTLLLGAGRADAGTILKNDLTWNGFSAGQPLGGVSTGTPTTEIGQTFVVPAGESALSRVRFFLQARKATLFGSTTPIPFNVQVFAWNNATSATVGAALFDSGMIQAPGAGTNPAFLQYDVAIPDLSVTAGAHYIMVLTTAPYAVSAERLFPGFVVGDYGSGGLHMYKGGVGGLAWVSFNAGVLGGTSTGSLAHEIEFTDTVVIPLPTAAGMGLAGMMILGVRRRRAPGTGRG